MTKQPSKELPPITLDLAKLTQATRNFALAIEGLRLAYEPFIVKKKRPLYQKLMFWRI